MKMKSLVCAGLGALALSTPAFAQYKANQHNVTFNVKITFEGPPQEKEQITATKTTFTSKSKFVVGKFSNREFLLELVVAGVISDIRGWSVVQMVDQGGGVIGIYIIKAGVPPIYVGDYLDYDLCEVVSAWDYKEVQSTNGDYEEQDKFTERGKSSLWLDVPNLCGWLRGSFTFNYQYSFFESGGIFAKAAPPVGTFEKITGGTLEALVGTGSYGNNNQSSSKGESEDDGEVLLEGSLLVGAPKLVNFDYFPE
jgi:hypothetical protein